MTMTRAAPATNGVAHATAVARDLPPVLRKRYAAIVLDGLRPGAASTLPGRPLNFEQLRRHGRSASVCIGRS